MTATKPFVKKPALLCGDLVQFDEGTDRAGRFAVVEALALGGCTLADVRMCDTNEFVQDVPGQDITRVNH